jgi:hypothetical protein
MYQGKMKDYRRKQEVSEYFLSFYSARLMLSCTEALSLMFG